MTCEPRSTVQMAPTKPRHSLPAPGTAWASLWNHSSTTCVFGGLVRYSHPLKRAYLMPSPAILVLDTETTGLDPGRGAVVGLGACAVVAENRDRTPMMPFRDLRIPVSSYRPNPAPSLTSSTSWMRSRFPALWIASWRGSPAAESRPPFSAPTRRRSTKLQGLFEGPPKAAPSIPKHDLSALPRLTRGRFGG